MTIPSYVIGIAGGTGAGKTAVAQEVADTVGEALTHIPLDNYYEDLSHLDFEERVERNYDHPSAFEWDLLVEQFDSLLAGNAIEMPQYDFAEHTRKDETVTVDPTGVIVLEGIFALYDERLREMFDLRVYVQTDADVRILRRVRRDVSDRGRDLEGVIDQYLSTVKPMHEQFVEPTKKHADVIIPEGVNRKAVGLLEEKVQAELDARGGGLTDPPEPDEEFEAGDASFATEDDDSSFATEDDDSSLAPGSRDASFAADTDADAGDASFAADTDAEDGPLPDSDR